MSQSAQPVTIFPVIGLPEVAPGDDLAALLLGAVSGPAAEEGSAMEEGPSLEEGDVLVVAKFLHQLFGPL